jgi:type I restriction enzyme S subunit
MNPKWPKLTLGEVLRRSDETIALQPDAEYRQITVKLWGKGVVLRGIVTGAEIAASRQMVARRGQFILSRIDARNGALSVVPPELDGAIVTNDFPLFNVVESRLLTAFASWLADASGTPLKRAASARNAERIGRKLHAWPAIGGPVMGIGITSLFLPRNRK